MAHGGHGYPGAQESGGFSNGGQALPPPDIALNVPWSPVRLPWAHEGEPAAHTVHRHKSPCQRLGRRRALGGREGGRPAGSGGGCHPGPEPRGDMRDRGRNAKPGPSAPLLRVLANGRPSRGLPWQ